jgi:high-affinity nickel permease
MSGLDDLLGGLAHGAPLLVVVCVAVLLGLRHATDPDHLVAVTSLLAGDGQRRVRRAGLLGAAWGTGHALTLTAFGLPVVLYGRALPDHLREAAEVAVGLVICLLAARLLRRWRRGLFHVHAHAHEDGTVHRHVHSHRGERLHRHGHVSPRSPATAFAIGILHGVGGSAGVGILLLASIPSRTVAAVCLVVFAVCTALSMAGLSTGIGYALTRRNLGQALQRLTPAFGVAGLAFGAWYAAAALVGG